MVATAFVGIGLSAILGGMAQLNRSEAQGRAREQELVLATRKMRELVATQDYNNAPVDGDFSAEGVPNLRWSLTSEPAQVESMVNLRLTVQDASGQDVATLDQMAFAPTVTTEATN